MMQEFFFANYCLRVDDDICNHPSMLYLARFCDVMPATHTFIVHMGDAMLLDQKYEEAAARPVVCKTVRFTIRDSHDSWTFLSEMDEESDRRNGQFVLECARDYSEMTLYISRQPFYDERLKKWMMPGIPVSSTIRAACEAGMVMRDGLPLHASLVEKDGYGVVFLGPSGTGKSTQARLWEKYQGADFIIGDRPGLRRIDGTWYGFGMPWDGKDNIKNAKSVPIKALVSLEQASENSIHRISKEEAIIVLLNQTMMPMWDDAAMALLTPLMGKLANEVPFYHLRNLPNEMATLITRNAICSF